jgi:hypothetical protein
VGAAETDGRVVICHQEAYLFLASSHRPALPFHPSPLPLPDSLTS